MSVRIAPNVSPDGTQNPGVVPALLLDEEDAWVELRLSEDNLREVVAAVAEALHGMSGAMLSIRQGTLESRADALTRVCSSEAVREAFTFRLDPASFDRLIDDAFNLNAQIDNLERCHHVSRKCDNLCEPGRTLCPIHEGN